jgi:hypothetical protein
MNTELKAYIRKEKKTPTGKVPVKIGMVICKKQPDGKVTIGWSLCRKGDKFDENFGYLKATKRQYSIFGHNFVKRWLSVTNSESDRVIVIPGTAYSSVEKMINRSKKYFKS